MATVETLLTAEEYRPGHGNDQNSELVQGKVIPMTMPAPKHGYCCAKIVRIVGHFVDIQNRGRVMSNDTGIVTERDPDSVRGADVCFYSYDRLPGGALSEGYLNVAPELIFEVRSPGDSWREILTTVSEYLNAGVLVVCVLDPPTETLTIYTSDQGPRFLTANQELILPEVLPGFAVPVCQFMDKD